MIILQKSIGFIINSIAHISKHRAGKIAMYLFTTPRRGQINEKQSDFLGTAFREELNYNGIPIMTYRWLGGNKTILLAHGWESNSARWQSLIESFKAYDYNIIALDAPAHGRSGSKRFNALLYSEFIEKVSNKFNPDAIIGHSVGGMATAFYQSKIQKNHKKLVLLGAPSEFSDVLQRYYNMMGYSKKTIMGIHHAIKENFHAEPTDFSTAKSVSQTNSKGLLIHDKDDNIIPYSDALLIKENFKNSKLITTQGLGHSLNDQSIHNNIYEFLES